MLVFWRIFSLLWKSLRARENFGTSVFSREIFRTSLVVELGLKDDTPRALENLSLRKIFVYSTL
jgi:hypothetical protein